MFPKSGNLESPTFLSFAKKQLCFFCNKPSDDPHHVPPVGRGVRHDFNVVGVCRACHDDCHQGRIGEERQHRGVVYTIARFVREASTQEFEQFARERQEWARKRGMGLVGIP